MPIIDIASNDSYSAITDSALRFLVQTSTLKRRIRNVAWVPVHAATNGAPRVTTRNGMVIGDELAPYTEHRVLDAAGLIHTKANLSIYAKTWAQVLDENRARLKFFQDRLEVKADKASSLKCLQECYAAYLEGVNGKRH